MSLLCTLQLGVACWKVPIYLLKPTTRLGCGWSHSRRALHHGGRVIFNLQLRYNICISSTAGLCLNRDAAAYMRSALHQYDSHGIARERNLNNGKLSIFGIAILRFFREQAFTTYPCWRTGSSAGAIHPVAPFLQLWDDTFSAGQRKCLTESVATGNPGQRSCYDFAATDARLELGRQ